MERGAAGTSLPSDLHIGHFRRAAGKIEQTYLVGLFTEFEGILVHYFRYGLKRRALNPKISHVMKLLSDRLQIHRATVDDADEVRSLRNALVHEGKHDPALDFATCTSRLGHFLSWLPPEWRDY